MLLFKQRLAFGPILSQKLNNPLNTPKIKEIFSVSLSLSLSLANT